MFLFFGILLIVLGIVSFFEGGIIGGIVVISFGGWFIFQYFLDKENEEKEKQKTKIKYERKIKLQRKYDNLKTIEENTKEYYEHHKTYILDGMGNAFIIEDEKLCKFEPLLDLDSYLELNTGLPQSCEHKLRFDKIMYYQLEGSKHEKQIISGGGGGGSSIKGAVIGEIIAGDVGAIIGSRKKIDEIKTEYKKIDDRRTVITLRNNKQVEYGPNLYELLLKHIPEKEYDNYIHNLKAKGRE